MADGCRRILVIDDSPEFLSFMDALLSAEGYAVETAQTLDAVRATIDFMRPGPDLIISDVRMPGQEPFAVLAVLDDDEKVRGTPLLFCTGAVQEVEQASARLKARGAEVLLKPFDIDDLLVCVAHLCNAHSAV